MLERYRRTGFALVFVALSPLLSAQDITQQSEPVAEKVLRLISQMRESGEASSADLQWIGKQALPLLIRAVDAETVDLAFVTKAARTLFTIGGEEVEAWLKRAQREYGVLKKRALIRGATGVSEVIPGFVRFVEDPDPEVRFESLRHGSARIPLRHRVDMLQDESSRVSERAWQSILNGPITGDKATLDALESLLPILREVPKNVDPQIRARIPRLYSHNEVLASTRGRELYLLSLREPLADSNWTGISVGNSGEPILPNEHADLVLAVAREIGSSEARESQLQQYLSSASMYWDENAFEQAMALAELGFSIQSEWMQRYCTPETVVRFLPHLVALSKWHDRYIFSLLNPSNTGTAFPYLKEYLRVKFGEVRENNRPHSIDAGLRAMAWIGTEESTAYTVELHTKTIPALETNDSTKEALVNALAPPHDRDNEFIRESLRQVLIGEDCLEDSVRIAQRYLVAIGDPEAIPFFLYPYALERRVGVIQELQPPRHPSSPLGFRGGYDEDEWGQILFACLDTGLPRAWGEAGALEARFGDSLPRACARAILMAMPRAEARYIRRNLEWVARSFDDGKSEGLSELVQGFLSHEDPEIRRVAAKFLPRFASSNEFVVTALTPLLSDPDLNVLSQTILSLGTVGIADSSSRLNPFLEHEDPVIRSSALHALVQLTPDRRVDLALPRMKDADANVRLVAISILEQSLDQRAIPALIAALRETRMEIKERAKSALAAIRHYYEEEQHWQRMQQGSTLSTETAAEALVLQAQQGATKAVRLAAINSLGTLAKPETLPILIELMQSEDQELAAAATAAINKINAK